MERLADIFRRRLNQHRLGQVSQASQVLFSAQKFLRDHFHEVPPNLKPLKLQNGTLVIGVPGAVWAHEVRGLSPRLLEELEERYGKNVVKRVRTKDFTPS